MSESNPKNDEIIDMGSFSVSIDAEDCETLFEIAQTFRSGTSAVKKDIKKAVDLASKAAEQGYVEAQLFLAEMYSIEEEVLDIAKANIWYKKVAEESLAKSKESTVRNSNQGAVEKERGKVSCRNHDSSTLTRKTEEVRQASTANVNQPRINTPVSRKTEERTQIFASKRKFCGTCTYWKGNRTPASSGLQIKAELKEGVCAISIMTNNPNTGKSKTASKRSLLPHMGTNCDDWRAWI